MKKTGIIRNGSRTVTKYAIILASGWTFLVAAIMLLVVNDEIQDVGELIRNEAQTHFLKDQAFRFWGASHGGIYVTPTDHTPPNPNLSHIPDRDIVTTEGKKLTLMNPAYMVRQLMEDYEELYGVRGRIISLKPLRSKNAPDEWERTALESFNHGITEAKEFADIDGKPYLRLMRPMIIKKTCLKCHGHQGYKEGDVRGGVGVSVPAEAYYAASREELMEHAITLGLLWLVGFMALIFGANHIKLRVREQKKMEEALAESEERFRNIAESMADWIWEIDSKGVYTYVSPNFESIMGYKIDEIIGKTPFDFMSSKEAKRVGQIFKEIIEKKEKILDLENWNLSKDGRNICFLTNGTPIIDEQCNLIGYRGVDKDITETKRLQELESRAERLETAGTIAAQVAHDFNNLLAPMMAYPEFVREELPENSPSLKYMDQIEKAAQRISDINQDLLAMGRRGHFNQEVLNLNTVVQHALSELEPYSKILKCETDLDDDLMAIVGGNAQLHRMITNLLYNAKDAMQSVGRITVKTENYYVDDVSVIYGRIPMGEYVKLTISDTGCGISDDIIQKIFDPFFSTKIANKKRGSGLGMSVVDAVIKDHNGYLDMSTKVGVGTSFFIYFPITRELVDCSDSDDICGGRETILIVDDDDVQREVSSQLLTKLGYTVCSVDSGEKAVEFLRENPQDLVILDMIMPGGIGGTETYQRILEISPRQKAIILSGFSESDSVIKAQNLGAGAFIKKPITKQVIAAAVRTELDRQVEVVV